MLGGCRLHRPQEKGGKHNVLEKSTISSLSTRGALLLQRLGSEAALSREAGRAGRQVGTSEGGDT